MNGRTNSLISSTSSEAKYLTCNLYFSSTSNPNNVSFTGIKGQKIVIANFNENNSTYPISLTVTNHVNLTLLNRNSKTANNTGAILETYQVDNDGTCTVSASVSNYSQCFIMTAENDFVGTVDTITSLPAQSAVLTTINCSQSKCYVLPWESKYTFNMNFQAGFRYLGSNMTWNTPCKFYLDDNKQIGVYGVQSVHNIVVLV